MDRLHEFLDALRRHQLVRGHFRAILHVVIGRTITGRDGVVVSNGVTWRELARLFQLMRWDKELVRELGLDPDELPPRDRQRFWYIAIAGAKVTAREAIELGDEFARLTGPIGFSIGPAPGN